MSKYIKGANHINLRPTHEKYDATIQLYTEVLGLPMTNFWTKDRGGFISRNCFVDCGNGTTLEICECETGTEAAGVIQHYAFTVYDVRETMQMLKDKGYQVVNSKGLPTDQMVLDVTVGDPAMHLNLGFIKSPSGELIEFVQEMD